MIPSGYPRKRLQPTGALREDALYIERASDQDLFDALLAGEFCSVLAPRQIGKSSLRVRTARRLSQMGIRCVQIDLTTLGKAADCDPIAAWYFSLACRIADELEMEVPATFFSQHKGLLAADRFGLYLRRQVLASLGGKVVIFLDEIDYVRALPIDRDEFFVAIRAFYNERAQHSDFCRLTFCLLGVASPKDLVAKPEITPFNIGTVIHLIDFSRSELEPFADALEPLGNSPQAWLDEVYRWTAGHPYMTQTLCAKLLSRCLHHQLGRTPASSVAREATSVFVRRGRSEDSNLGYAEKRLDESPLKNELLSLYRQLLEQENIRYDGGDPIQQELQLCGMAAPACGTLKVRNQIFASVFDLSWLAEKQTQSTLSQALRRWHQSGRSATSLLRGAALSQVQQWAREHPRDITIDEREFLNICFDTTQQESERRSDARRGPFIRTTASAALTGIALLAMASLILSVHSPKQAHYATSGMQAALQTEQTSAQAMLAVQLTERALGHSQLAVRPLPAISSGHKLLDKASPIVGSPSMEHMRAALGEENTKKIGSSAASKVAIRVEKVDERSVAARWIQSCAKKLLRTGLLPKTGTRIQLARTGQLKVLPSSALATERSLQLEDCLSGMAESEIPSRAIIVFQANSLSD